MLILRRSDIDKYLACKRRFWLEYHHGIHRAWPSKDRPPTNADIGTMFHLLREKVLKGEDVPFPRQVCEAYVAEQGCTLSSEWSKTIDYPVAMIQRWMQDGEHKFYDDYTIHGVEHNLLWERINDLPVAIECTLDVWMEDKATGLHTIEDGKTVASIDRQLPGYTNFQGLTYAVLLQELEGVTPFTFEHAQAKRVKAYDRAKPPFFNRAPLILTEEMIATHKRRLIHLVHEIHEFTLNAKGVGGTWHWTHAMPSPNGECGWKCNVSDLCEGLEMGEDIRPMFRPSGRVYYLTDKTKKEKRSAER